MRLGIVIAIEIGFLALLAWTWFGRRPTVEQFAAAHRVLIDETSIAPVETALRRTYVGRVLGALGGAVLLGCVALPLSAGAAIGAAFIGLVAGTMVGIALAQHRARPVLESVRHASLDARTIADYAPSHASWWIALNAVACSAAIALVIGFAPAGLGPYAPALVLAATTLLIVPVGYRLQRRIVEAPRDQTEPAIDDALRSAAVLAVHHAVLGVLLCGLAVACVGGILTHATWTVESDDATVFTAPPGTTSISVDTGLRQANGPDAPIRVFWIDADGEHDTGWIRAVGSVSTASPQLTPVGQLLGWVLFVAVIAAFVQWSRATTASRRRPPSIGTPKVTASGVSTA